MPYKYKKEGDKYVVYKKDTGEKVGSTEGNETALKKYLAALHINANENKITEDTLREKIHNLLKEIIVDEHAEQRLRERLLSKNGYEVGYEDTPMNYIKVGRYFIPDNIKQSILNKVDVLRNKSFPKNKDYGIKLEAIPIDINSINFYEGFSSISIKGKNLVLIPGGDESNGNIYYAIIRGNIMKTFMLMKSYIKIDSQKLRVDYIISNWDTIVQNKVR